MKSSVGVSGVKETKSRLLQADGTQIGLLGEGESSLGPIPLRRVLVAPAIKKNILSIARISDEGFSVLIGDSNAVFKKGRRVVGVGKRKGDEYYVEAADFRVEKKEKVQAVISREQKWKAVDSRRQQKNSRF